MILLPRGVHREPVLSADGHPVIVAVNHKHQEVQRRVILPGENPFTVVALLWEHLDQVDAEYSRRQEPGRQIAASLSALICTSLALEKALALIY